MSVRVTVKLLLPALASVTLMPAIAVTLPVAMVGVLVLVRILGLFATLTATLPEVLSPVSASLTVKTKLSAPIDALVSVNVLSVELICASVPLSVSEVLGLVPPPVMVKPGAGVALKSPWALLIVTVRIVDELAEGSEIEMPAILVACDAAINCVILVIVGAETTVILANPAPVA